MEKRIVRWAVSMAITLALAAAASAQAQQSQPTFEQAALRQWNAVHKKVAEMAKDFPEDKMDSRPHKDARSFIEEVWHVTATAEWFATQLRGEQVDAQKFFGSYDGRPRIRAELLAQLEKAIKEVAALLEQKPSPRAIALIEHAGEHYGKLATIYRINGLVPPATRSQGND